MVGTPAIEFTSITECHRHEWKNMFREFGDRRGSTVGEIKPSVYSWASKCSAVNCLPFRNNLKRGLESPESPQHGHSDPDLAVNKFCILITFAQGLSLPSTLNGKDASYLAFEYATATCDLIQAETVIAERRRRRLLLAAEAYRLHLRQLHCKRTKAEGQVSRYKMIAASYGLGVAGTKSDTEREQSEAGSSKVIFR
jgi:hypothetical protein